MPPPMSTKSDGAAENDTDIRRFYERHGFTNSHPGTVERMLCYPQEFCGTSSGQHATGTLR